MIRLFDLPHGRSRALLATGAPVFLPVNPVEYHGPHLSLHNDALISLGLARGVHTALAETGDDWPLLVASDLEIGVDPCPGPGTRRTSYSDACTVVVEACRALLELGAQRVVLITFHGSPLHNLALDAGARWLARHGVRVLSPMNALLAKMLDLRVEEYADAYAAIADGEERALVMRDAALDFHAGFFETSLSLYYAPDSVDPLHARLPRCPDIVPDAKLLSASRAAERCGRAALSRELLFSAYGLGWYALRPFPGYTSRPHLASREAGACFARHLTREFAALAQRVLRSDEPPPRPVMRWMAPATLGGTVGTVGVPLDAVARFEELRGSAA
jgi:creatinine amidohydrolase